MSSITKAVFPVAGFGTRFLPATKAMPKELLPIIDKPIVQYAVEEAVQAGITELIFVTGRNKRAVGDHFDANLELESQLLAKGKSDLRDMVRNIVPEGVSCIFVRQPEPLGLGHAVLCAAPAVGKNPFVVLLADDLMQGSYLPTQALVEAFSRYPHTILSVSEVDAEDVSKYGILKPGVTGDDGMINVDGLVEKPSIEDALSRMASFGRYVFTPEIFDILRGLAPGAGGEIQLADAIDHLARQGKVSAILNAAKRYDCGDKFGYLTAIVDVALSNPVYGAQFLALLRDRLERPESGNPDG
ncbi:UTP--glucose-1-phosphate uridylyltransferase GalU [Roseinatronobacter bogoriensis]|uniref:UTP--glucose-1-phosphate uridylyltransferase n=1 Tax=Roseinatronobacter bogoriensis subsp. barguzinensis TaxID=441209 RepID=A0A2K8K8W3_9RHOB|nr:MULTISPECIES: UTP--glucose-1-phosphate uridylyltransferase GalU [Rhodobaca]ATX65884.1 UTP--glucose-1-phosphate uridylyltransferase [Rhodobaca barguzinensis]TDW38786.1 UTP--glucose-1-phosphate uridylyltransferase [Rhodobaca barguzinensis]TDY69176.1 UDP-glucose pyrophosphorylase [Rhodobaca bogoriensis DSM 18756]